MSCKRRSHRHFETRTDFEATARSRPGCGGSPSGWRSGRNEDLLRTQENTPGTYTNLIGTFVVWCSRLTNAEARTLERILDDAGVPVVKDVWGLSYGARDVHALGATDFSLMLNAILPDGR